MMKTSSFFSEIFSKKGLLAQNLSGYELREGQQQMTSAIWEAFEHEKTALFEAGTGIGKSLAYLIPSLLWSAKTGEKIVISTYTISLQEQLFEKDLPFLLEILGLDLRVVLAKGMGNYLCLRKVEEASKQNGFFDQTLDAIIDWSKRTLEGTKTSLPFFVSNDSWNKVYAESDACSYAKCPHYRQCFFFKARSKSQTADIIIVNHHLLMAHLLADEERSILPSFDRLIIDEAHHLEQVARNSTRQTIDRVNLFKILGKIHSDAHPETSRLFTLRDQMEEKSLKTRLDLDLPAQKRELLTKIHAAFDALDVFFPATHFSYKWRITEKMMQNEKWQKELHSIFARLQESLRNFAASLESIENEIEKEIKSKVENALLDIAQVAGKLKVSADLIDSFFKGNDVQWAERTPEGIHLTHSQLDISPFLEEKIFSHFKSTILCSATLSIDGSFSHAKNNLGIKKEVIEAIYPSPFDFQNRTRLLGIKDISAPSSPYFINEACEVIREAIEISQGGAFILFTSYEMLEKCAEKLSDLSVLKQGDLSRHRLLEEFRKNQNGILLGTDSFWEGVDVAGKALRLVIIVKLPFPVPTEPLLEARSELLRADGRDPFTEDSLPQAVMKFKQGFGRLMRRKEDRGCVLCLDQRLFNRSYGKIFVRSLPSCIVSFDHKDAIFEEMRAFYWAAPAYS